MRDAKIVRQHLIAVLESWAATNKHQLRNLPHMRIAGTRTFWFAEIRRSKDEAILICYELVQKKLS